MPTSPPFTAVGDQRLMARHESSSRPGWNELEVNRAPVVAHLDREGETTGYFGALIGLDEQIALVPERAVGWSDRLLKALTATMVFGSVGLLGLRLKQHGGRLTRGLRAMTGRLVSPGGAALWCCMTLAAPSVAAETALPEEVQAALRENAKQLSPLTVEFSWRYTTNLSQREAMKRFKLENRDPEQFFHPVVYKVSWQNNKLYRYRELPVVGDRGFSITRQETGTDGVTLYSGSRDDTQPMFVKHVLAKIAKEAPNGEYLDVPYFSAAGYHFPSLGEWTDPRAESDIMYRIRMGGRLESVAPTPDGLLGVTLVAANPDKLAAKSIDIEKEREILKFSRETPERQAELLANLEKRLNAVDQQRFVYYLDPKRHYAVVGWEHRSLTGELLRRATCDRLERVSNRPLWLPHACRIELYVDYLNPDRVFSEPVLFEEVEVSRIDPSPLPASRFVFEYREPGTLVLDGTFKDAVLKDGKKNDGFVRYTIPAQARHLDEIIRRAKRGENVVVPPPPPLIDPNGMATWWDARSFFFINAGLVAAIFAYVYWRRRRAVA